MTRLIATDLDGTLIGHPASLPGLLEAISSHRWHLAYVTGRSLESARRLARREGLPEPDAWATEVGTAITYAGGSRDAHWATRLASGWRRERVLAAAAGVAGLEPQPADCQGPYKASWYLAPDGAASALAALRERLGAAGVSARLVYSSDRDLDILPAAGGKGEAVGRIRAHFGLGAHRCLTCGDSGNDRDMLAHGGPAVAVGNTRPDLLCELPEGVYRAAAPCSAGILEALEHFGWLGDPA